MVNYQTWVNPKESNRSGCLSHLSNARRQNTYYIPLLVNSLILCATNAKSFSLFVKLIRLGLGISYLKDPVTLHTYLMWDSVETQSLSLSVSHCALACRMMNLYTWCWCQREWGTDGALRSEERLRTPIGRRMQPNTITDIHSLFVQLKYEYRTVFFWIGK